MPERIYAVQLAPGQPWHAVSAHTSMTYCGRSTRTATAGLWRLWEDRVDRCSTCERGRVNQ